MSRQAGIAEGSLSLLEAVLRANEQWPGRKIVVLFTSEAFRIVGTINPMGRMKDATRPILDLAQRGFTIWTVDSGGMSGGKWENSSALLSSLAQDTGGHSFRVSSDLKGAFSRAAAQLSCYYLISLPVTPSERSNQHALDVAIDTNTYPNLSGLSIRAPTQVSIIDPKERLMRTRIAALQCPEDFSQPPVDTVVYYPTLVGGKDVLRARVHVPLATLAWTAQPDGTFKAEVLVEALVERQTELGSEMVCAVGAEDTGKLSVTLARKPRLSDRAGLVVELPCAYGKDGLYVGRGVVTDLSTGHSGADRSTVMVKRAGRDEWAAMALRVEASSGRDFLWRPGLIAVARDRGHTLFRQVHDAAPADTGDEIALSYVLCGPEREAAARRVRHLLVSEGADGSRRVRQTFPATAVTLAEPLGKPSFCTQATVRVAPYVLEAGHYAFAVLGPEAGEAATLLASASAANTPSGVLGYAPFSVGP